MNPTDHIIIGKIFILLPFRVKIRLNILILVQEQQSRTSGLFSDRIIVYIKIRQALDL